MIEWKPIQTAPKDGTQILLCSVDPEDGIYGIRHGFYEKGTADRCWYDIDGDEIYEPDFWSEATPPPKLAVVR